MLIILGLFIAYVVVPYIITLGIAVFEPTMVIVIMIAGLVLVFGAVGVHISNNLGSTVVNGIFSAIGFVFVQIFRGIGWIVRTLVNSIPRYYRWLVSLGMRAPWAVLVTIITFAIII